jgi:hypothetical protein
MTTRPTSPSPPPVSWPLGTPDVSALLGDWVNTDRRGSKGARLLSVTWRDEGLFVRAVGAGGPQPRYWGEAPAVPYTAPDTPTTAWSFSVVYEFGSLRTVVCAYYKTGILITTTATVLGGDRVGADHWARSFFHRAEGPA